MGMGNESYETNHTTARKPGPLLIIEYSLVICVRLLARI
jgi:hypothetical protein